MASPALPSRVVLLATLTSLACRPASGPRPLGWRVEDQGDHGGGGYEFVQTNARGDATRWLGTVGDSLEYLTLSGDVVAVPLEGGAASPLATSLWPMVAVDANGIAFVDAECRIFDGRRRPLGACRGEPRWIRVDRDGVYVLTDDAPMNASAGTTLWHVARAGGTARELTKFDAAGQPPPDFLADDDFLYYATPERVMRVPRRGGPATTLLELPSFRAKPKLAFLDKTHLYWSTDEYVVRMPKQGGELARVTEGPGRITSDGAHFYWLEASSQYLYAAPVNGGSWRAHARLPKGDWNIVPRGRRVYAVDDAGVTVLRLDADARPPDAVLEQPSSHPFVGLAVGATSLAYAATRYDEASQREIHEVRTVPKSGGTPNVIASDERVSSALATDAEFAYYRVADGSIHRAPLRGGTPVVIVPAVPLTPAGEHLMRLSTTGELRSVPLPDVQVDGADVYWIDATRRAIAKAPKRGGPASTLVQSNDALIGLALDESHVYFTRAIVTPDTTYGVVVKVPKAGGVAAIVASMGGKPTRLVLTRSYVVFSHTMPAGLGYVGKNGGENSYVATEDDGVVSIAGVGSLAAAGDDVYFTRGSESHDSDIVRVALPSGRTAVLASGQDRPISLQADERAVYWINSGFTDGKMHRRIGCCAILTSPR